jgi:cell wall-associated NlpC family hydrolase
VYQRLTAGCQIIGRFITAILGAARKQAKAPFYKTSLAVIYSRGNYEMKLHLVWAKRLAIMTLAATIVISGGVLGNPQHASAAEAAVSAYASSKADKIISLGQKYKGTPYKFGAKVGQTRTFDCSSLTKYIYGRYGIYLP